MTFVSCLWLESVSNSKVYYIVVVVKSSCSSSRFFATFRLICWTKNLDKLLRLSASLQGDSAKLLSCTTFFICCRDVGYNDTLL